LFKGAGKKFVHFKTIRYRAKQSWATEAMKQWDEALNASSLQFLCRH
jgi:hypothetical protein